MSYPAQIGFVRSIPRFCANPKPSPLDEISDGIIVESGPSLAAPLEVAFASSRKLDHSCLAPSLDLEHSLLNMIYRKREKVA